MNSSLETNDTSLGLSTVLVGSLPDTLQSEQAPELYTVEAIFTRRPEQEEVDAIVSAGSRVYLAGRGYPDVRLTVADRRLQIENSSLELLRDGLAEVIADLLLEISNLVQQHQREATAIFQDLFERETAREAAVVELAESVVFAPKADLPVRQAGDATSEGEAGQVSEWLDEGGALRP
ncbi:hypothetical protein [Leucobacter luti]|uniref:hypothetical protein n=1 Tax=Leucobacter luti TaxID=340320 RepID=UPI00102AB2FB|nr:hypothetical protein [Leucobacter luti]